MPASLTQIELATSPQQMELTRKLFREYQEFLGLDLCFQDFEAELNTLPGKYAHPTGAILLAWHQDQLAGCVAVRPMKGGLCEMKRLFVRPEFRGLKLGMALVKKILEVAQALGYDGMVLDSVDTLQDALRLYHQFGFRPIPPYYHNPFPNAVYLGLNW